MKKITTIYVLLILLFVLFLPLNLLAQQSNVVTRGVWLWGSVLNNQGSQSVVNKLKENYVNKVFLLVKGTNGTKISAPLLTDFIARAHAEEIEVHLWYVISQDAAFVSLNPNSVIYHSPKPGEHNNQPYPMTGDSRINLLYPGYKEYVLDNISYFLNNFDCDGIHLDYIRYPHLVYSFDQYHLAQAESLGCNTQRLLQMFIDNYTAMSGSGFINMYAGGDEDVVKWVEMRNNVVYDYIISIRELINQIKPGIELNAAFMPEGAYDRFTADSHYGQNYTLTSPLLDEIHPMAYFNSYGQPPSWLKLVTQGAMAKVSPNCRIATGFQTFDNVTPLQVRQQIQSSLEGGAAGVVNFRYGTTSFEQWAVIKDEFKKIHDAQPKTLTNQEIMDMCKSVSDSMNAFAKVPSLIYTDAAETSYVSAANFYYLMVRYLKHYLNNNNPPAKLPIIRNIAGPSNPGGVQTGNQIMLADILESADSSSNFINLINALPNFTTVDSVDYDPAAMFWVYARTINWYRNNLVMPNFATVRACAPPDIWTYGDDISSIDNKKDQMNKPESFNLYQNYPNPFNPSTVIEFYLSEPGFTTLKVYDLLGREVYSLVDNYINAGFHKVNFDGTYIPSGMYLYKLNSENSLSVKKMLLLK